METIIIKDLYGISKKINFNKSVKKEHFDTKVHFVESVLDALGLDADVESDKDYYGNKIVKIEITI